MPEGYRYVSATNRRQFRETECRPEICRTMLIVLIIFAFLLLAVFVCGVAIGRVGRDHLRVQLATLRGEHKTLVEAYADMRRIAGELLKAAHEKHFPKDDLILTWDSRKRLDEAPEQYIVRVYDEGQANYVPPVEKHCPECSVSVRSETWPQECPACHSVFGFDE